MKRSIGLLACLALMTHPALAYVDPGTTGLISQMAYLVFYAVLAGLGFFFRPIKNAWNSLFRRKRVTNAQPAAAPDASSGD